MRMHWHDGLHQARYSQNALPETGHTPGCSCFARTEEVIGLRWLCVPCNKVAEASIPQDLAECSAGLFKDLFPMGNVQQPCLSGVVPAKSDVVECGNHRFSGTCCSYHEVLLFSGSPFSGNIFKDNLLIAIKAQVEKGDGVVRICFRALLQQSLLKGW